MESTYITAIHIKHVRYLREIQIPISANTRKNLILTGKNGSGKTSVLKALVLHLEYLVDDNSESNEYEKQIADLQSKRLKDDAMEAQRKQLNRLKAYMKALSCLWTDSNGVTIDFTSLDIMKEKYKNGEFILAYYGDTRKIEVATSNNIEKIEFKPFYAIQDVPSRDLSKYLVNLKTTQAFAQTSGDYEQANQIKLWFQRFEEILREIYHNSSLELKFDINTFRFSICMEGRDPFDFNTMSMGYAAVFEIIGDLMMRMESKKRYDLEGIVLIDEIETHLHVELQKEILPILTRLFPNLQFILTTHSPFILNSAKDSVVYDLEKQMLAANGLTNLSYSGIVEGYFDVDTLSQELRKNWDRYRDLIQRPVLSNPEEAEIAELEMYLDEIPDYLALDFIDEYSRLKLEHHR